MDMLNENSMRHFLLYAKGHYEKSDLMTDMKQIAAHRAQMKPEHIRESDILFLLLGEVERLAAKKEHFLQQFVTRIREDFVVWPALLRTPRIPTLDEVIVTACLGELATAKVKDGTTVYLNLGEPDPAVLPLTKTYSPTF